ncbi:MAG: biotin synthase BioB [Paramuribaculum sp.]|nr:biotin synthase BioB [Paramuribaculum sp.]
MDIRILKEKILAGGQIEASEALALARLDTAGQKKLREAAAEITAHFHSRKFDTCSIVNARSGRCSENCKWCAQSAHYSTGVKEYELVDHDTCIDLALYNRSQGVGRFSFVTSGRRLGGKAFSTLLDYYRELNDRHSIYLCASMGLLDEEQLRQLREAGVRRYHCNLETAPSHFPSLCSTHSIDDKMATIRAARAAGLEICSGGIIGMGETMEQRAEFALKLREAEPVSIPINILHPIPGTPLADAPALTPDEVLTTVAIFRMVHPRVVLRFAGGRDRLDVDTQKEAIRIGINGSIIGDLLTTIGSRIAEDKQMVADCGMEF